MEDPTRKVPPRSEGCGGDHGLASARKRVLVDASSAILLLKCGMFEDLLAAYRVGMAPSVSTELERPSHPGAARFRRCRSRGEVFVAPPKVRLGPGDLREKLARLHPGERDTILAYLSGWGDFVLMDDGDGARSCRDACIPFVNALLVPRVLCVAGRCTAEATARHFRRLQALGRYAPWVVVWAREASEDALRPFAP